MLFCSEQFLIFFTIIFILYWSIPWHQARVWLLLAGSFAFYATWNKQLAILICVSTLVDYLIGLGLERRFSKLFRRTLLGVSLCMNLGLLAYFKYANFFLRSIEDVLHAAGNTASLPVLK